MNPPLTDADFPPLPEIPEHLWYEGLTWKHFEQAMPDLKHFGERLAAEREEFTWRGSVLGTTARTDR